MNKIVNIIVFLCLSGFFLNCKRDYPTIDQFEEWKLRKETIGRSGPGFLWQLSTEELTDGHFDLAGNRLFYLNTSRDHIREVTLTVTKLNETFQDPTFRIYGRFQQCLLMSTPTVSSGTFNPSGIFQRNDLSTISQYSGITWTPSLSKSLVNSKETYKFKVYMDSKDSLCTEGFIQVDMIAPVIINSQGSYSDGDYLYFVKRNIKK
jgi:hypothetical protein